MFHLQPRYRGKQFLSNWRDAIGELLCLLGILMGLRALPSHGEQVDSCLPARTLVMLHRIRPVDVTH